MSQVSSGVIGSSVRRPSLLTRCSAAVFLFLLSCGVLAPFLAPHDPYSQDLLVSLQLPSMEYWLGTDEQGRGILSRLLYALRVDFYAAFVAVGIGVLLGVPAGALLGYCGGTVDWIGMRLVEAALAIPPIVWILVVVAVVGQGLTSAMLALGAVFTLPYIRIVRGEMLGLRNSLFVRAARTTGVSHLSIVIRHLLPTLLPIIIVQTGLMLPVAFLVEATLSYLGLSVQPPSASLGTMLREAQEVALLMPWQVLPAGVVLLLVALSLNLLADGINEWINPKANNSRFLQGAAGSLGTPTETRHHLPIKIDNLILGLRTSSKSASIAVDNVSIDVRAGEIVAIVGESGSGKSLTAMSAVGLLPSAIEVHSGSIQTAGTEVTTATASEMRALRSYKVGVVFQDPISSLNPSVTIGRQLIAPLVRHHGMDRSKAREIILSVFEEVGISEPELRLRQYPHELSGGLAQRVMIALALSRNPEVLIADEPTSALDVSVQVKVLDLLKRLSRSRNLAILLITHDMGVVRYAADRVLVMYAGSIVEQGDLTVLDSPRHPYTAALLAAAPKNVAQKQALPIVAGQVPQPGPRPEGCLFSPRCVRSTDDCGKSVAMVGDSCHAFRCINPL